MTRKDFVVIAEIFVTIKSKRNTLKEVEVINDIIDEFIPFLKSKNNRFDADIFRNYINDRS